MANAHSFPLLRLPHLARVHVMKLIDILELYHLSNISKKSKILVKICNIPCILDMKLYYFDRQSSRKALLFIRKDRNSEPFKILITTNEYVAERYDPIGSVEYKVENVREFAIEKLEFCNGLFEIARFGIQFVNVPNDITKQFLGVVRGLQIDIYSLSIEIFGKGADNEMYNWIMDECRDVKRLNNSLGTTEDFQWDTQQPFTFEFCYLQFAPFLTLDHLTRLFWSCRSFQIVVNGHKMTNQDFNQLVKMWIEGGSKLEYLEICVDGSINLEEVMADIEKVPVERACIENVPCLFDPDEDIAYKVLQHNGKEAVVCLLDDEQFIITSHSDEKDCDLWSECELSYEKIGGDEEEDVVEEEAGEDGDSDN